MDVAIRITWYTPPPPPANGSPLIAVVLWSKGKGTSRHKPIKERGTVRHSRIVILELVNRLHWDWTDTWLSSYFTLNFVGYIFLVGYVIWVCNIIIYELYELRYVGICARNNTSSVQLIIPFMIRIIFHVGPVYTRATMFQLRSYFGIWNKKQNMKYTLRLL